MEPQDKQLTDVDADAALRSLLQRYEEPRLRQAPPLHTAVRRRLPALPPYAAAQRYARQQRIRQLVSSIALSGLVACLLLGSWGVFFDSHAPAELLGGAEQLPGRLLLMLTLLAKPISDLLLGQGPLALSSWLLGLAAVLFCWWLVVREPPVIPAISKP